MSRLRANKITNQAADGAPTVENGLIISGVTTVTGSINNLNLTGITTISTLDLNGDLDVDGHTNLDNTSIVGIVTISAGTNNEGLRITGQHNNCVIFTSPSINGSAGYRLNHHPQTNFLRVDTTDQNGTFTGIVAKFSSAGLDMADNIKLRLGSNQDLTLYHYGNNAYIDNADGDFIFRQGTSEKLRIDSNGKILYGHTAALTKFHGPGSTTKRNPRIQVNGTNVNDASMSLTSWDNNVNAYYGPALYLAKSGSSTIGTNSRVSNQNSILGSIVFSGDDGDEFIKGAMIQGAVDNIDGAQTGGNDMPGRLQFLTTQDGAQEPTERLRILSNGRIKFIEDPIQRNSGSVDSFSGDGAYMQHYVSRNGSTYRRNLDIAAVGDGSWGCSIRFSTNPDSSSTSLERMRIDHRGIVTKPYHPSFCARHDDNSTFSGDIIVLTRISTSWDVWNTGGHYSTSTGKFTAPVTGVYYFEGQLMTTGHSNGDNIQDMFSLMSNRGRITYVRQRESYFSTSTNANGYYTNSLGSSVRLDAGDTVWLQRHSSQNWGYSNRYYSYFTGWLIG